MTRRTRIAAFLSVWMGLGAIASPIGTLVHTATTEHRWCETHQHLVHADDAPAVDASGVGFTENRSGAATEDVACELAHASRRDAVAGLAATPDWLARDRWARPLPPEAGACGTPVLTLAPKQDPPRV